MPAGRAQRPTIRGGVGNDAVGVVGTEDPLPARSAPVTIFNSPFTARNDVVDGGTGKDTLELRGTFESESLDLSAAAAT